MGLYPTDATEIADDGKDRNALKFGLTSQSELWNSPLAMIGFVAYLLQAINSYSLIREVRNFRF